MVCIALATMFAYDLAYNFIRKDENVAYDSDGEKVTLTIQKGAKCKEIAELLEKEGIIEDSMAFRLRAKLNGAGEQFPVWHLRVCQKYAGHRWLWKSCRQELRWRELESPWWRAGASRRWGHIWRKRKSV